MPRAAARGPRSAVKAFQVLRAVGVIAFPRGGVGQRIGIQCVHAAAHIGSAFGQPLLERPDFLRHQAAFQQPQLTGWNGIGFVIQAYQKRCPYVIDYVIDLARRSRHRLMIRLVKGAYWDSEIKRAQVEGLEGYPVYTRKVYTDVSYIACARKLLSVPGIAAGSIFTFSLTLGDFIVPQLVGPPGYFVGGMVYAQQGAIGNMPMAAAFTLVPIVLIAVYLSIVKRLGAFDAL